MALLALISSRNPVVMFEKLQQVVYVKYSRFKSTQQEYYINYNIITYFIKLFDCFNFFSLSFI